MAVNCAPDPGLQPRRGGMLVARGDNPGYGDLPPMYGFRVVSVIESPGCTRRYRYAAPTELKIIFLVLFPGVGTPGY
ncbi:MAG: hypothetical protein K9G38_01605, partial [Bacteroidales bacterium]|nr:hypothetical protein [Bacteroidales bacterium]